MAEARYVVDSPLSPDEVWVFCTDTANWVGLIPGYVSHETLDDRHSRWKVQVDLGPFTRLVEADAIVTEVVPDERIAFELKGSNATPFVGEGRVHAETRGDVTSIHVDVAMHPQGPLGPVVNAVASPVLPRVVRAFVDALIERMRDAAATKAAARTCPAD
jgi:carbon monoxide dehydrogenase subunit G